MDQFQNLYKRPRKTTVQLTSLLDLLFVMIFVSLLQQKAPTTPRQEQKVATKKIKVEAKQKVKPIPPPPKKAVYNIEAKFKFYATASTPNIPNGEYLMQGTYNKKTGELKLGGVGWLNRPKHYDMVPLSGKIGSSGKTFTGRIEFQTCKEFTLQRTATTKGTPISGTWKGSYECAQGSTGLTLTVL